MGDFRLNLAFLDVNFPTRRKFSDNCPTAQNLEGAIAPFPLCHDATKKRSS